MSRFFFFGSIFLLWFPLITEAQNINQNLRIRARIIAIPSNGFNSSEEPPQFSYVPLKYKVLRVCKGGDLKDGAEIIVAHGPANVRKLKVGDELVLEIKWTRDFRETAEILGDNGIKDGEEFIADYIFLRFAKYDSCPLP